MVPPFRSAGGHAALAGGLSQTGDLAGDGQQALALDALHIGHHQAGPAIHRHADVAGTLVVNLGRLIIEPAVEDREFPHRQRQRLHEEGHQVSLAPNASASGLRRSRSASSSVTSISSP